MTDDKANDDSWQKVIKTSYVNSEQHIRVLEELEALRAELAACKAERDRYREALASVSSNEFCGKECDGRCKDVARQALEGGAKE